jgi:PUA domain protein
MSELRVRKRRRLREKEVRGLAEELLVSTGLSIFKIGDTVDIAESPEYRVIIFENQIIGFLQDGKAFLTIRGLLKHPITKSFVTVDMGAIKFVINGADVMGPGIVDADDDIQIGDFVWVRDENNKKPLAVGQALITGTEMKEKKPGKAIKSVLFVGDKLWKFDER